MKNIWTIRVKKRENQSEPFKDLSSFNVIRQSKQSLGTSPSMTFGIAQSTIRSLPKTIISPSWPSQVIKRLQPFDDTMLSPMLNCRMGSGSTMKNWCPYECPSAPENAWNRVNGDEDPKQLKSLVTIEIIHVNDDLWDPV